MSDHGKPKIPLFWESDYTYSPQPRLIQAFLRGEVTIGGMAEAGWFSVGRITPGFGPMFIRKADDE